MKYSLSFLAITTSVCAANRCVPNTPTCYFPDDCQRCYCLGPAEIIANASARPVTCDGDISIFVAGMYWKAEQDGMEYAIDSVFSGDISNANDARRANNLIDATYLSPNFKWNFGFKLGLGYSFPCDGWEISLAWTNFQGKASSHDEAEDEDNHVLLQIWSALQLAAGTGPFLGPIVRDMQSSWNLDFQLVDLVLGREFWVSHFLTASPYLGLRYVSTAQSLHFQLTGGELDGPIPRLKFIDYVDIDNDFWGTGIQAGINTHWHFGCGWSLYGNLGTAIVYGKFDVDQDEYLRRVTSPFTKRQILQIEDHFKSSRAMLDLALGVQWMGLLCDCKYGFLVALGWEQHLFFHQNQMWRVDRMSSILTGSPNNGGVNDHHQRRGTLGTQGLTLSLRFDF